MAFSTKMEMVGSDLHAALLACQLFRMFIVETQHQKWPSHVSYKFAMSALILKKLSCPSESRPNHLKRSSKLGCESG